MQQRESSQRSSHTRNEMEQQQRLHWVRLLHARQQTTSNSTCCPAHVSCRLSCMPLPSTSTLSSMITHQATSHVLQQPFQHGCEFVVHYRFTDRIKGEQQGPPATPLTGRIAAGGAGLTPSAAANKPSPTTPQSAPTTAFKIRTNVGRCHSQPAASQPVLSLHCT